MGIAVVRYQDGEQGSDQDFTWGLLEGDVVYPLTRQYVQTADVFRAGAAALRDGADRSQGRPLTALTILSPVTKPTKLVCLGVNYAPHRAESGLKPLREDAPPAEAPFAQVVDVSKLRI